MKHRKALLTATVDPDIYEAIKHEAKSTDRSISNVANYYLCAGYLAMHSADRAQRAVDSRSPEQLRSHSKPAVDPSDG